MDVEEILYVCLSISLTSQLDTSTSESGSCKQMKLKLKGNGTSKLIQLKWWGLCQVPMCRLRRSSSWFLPFVLTWKVEKWTGNHRKRSDIQPPATNNASSPCLSVYIMALGSAQVGAVVVGRYSCQEITPRKLLVVPDENEPRNVQLHL